jgi:predicted transcriptional regulator
MAPNLAPSKHELIYDMIHSGELSMNEMAQAAGCNKSTISRISSNIRMFGSVKAPPIKGGRPRNITPVMLEALCDHLIEKPALYLDEMAVFLWDEFAL